MFEWTRAASHIEQIAAGMRSSAFQRPDDLVVGEPVVFPDRPWMGWSAHQTAPKAVHGDSHSIRYSPTLKRPTTSSPSIDSSTSSVLRFSRTNRRSAPGRAGNRIGSRGTPEY